MNTSSKKAIILFNDKDPVLARVSKVKFKNEAGWDLVITSSYKEAISEFKKSKPDLIVTEILLNDNKGRNGFDLIKEIRSIDNNRTVPIVVLTDLMQKEDEEKAKKSGADYYYVKSQISIKELITKLQGIIQ